MNYHDREEVRGDIHWLPIVTFAGVMLITLPILIIGAVIFDIAPREFFAAGEDPSQKTPVDNGSFGEEDREDPLIPTRIVARSVGMDTPVVVPSSTDINVLNTTLTRGAVYYPGSGLVGAGNTFVFGHSSGYKVVRNPAYKAFNGIGALSPGDLIEVHTEQGIYLYKVDTIRKTTADEAYVEFSNTRDMLTLSTCNVFGSEEERFVAEATFIGQAA